LEAQVKLARLLAVVILVSVAASTASPQIFTRPKRIGPPAGPKIYSNVRYHQDSGDLLGDELVLVILGQKVSATLNNFQGDKHPNQSVMNGTLVEGRLRLYGKDELGKFRLTGTLSGNQLTAVITGRRVGQPPTSRRTQMRLVKKCWFSTCAGPAN
jgi:hypothetical protein